MNISASLSLSRSLASLLTYLRLLEDPTREPPMRLFMYLILTYLLFSVIYACARSCSQTFQNWSEFPNEWSGLSSPKLRIRIFPQRQQWSLPSSLSLNQDYLAHAQSGWFLFLRWYLPCQQIHSLVSGLLGSGQAGQPRLFLVAVRNGLLVFSWLCWPYFLCNGGASLL